MIVYHTDIFKMFFNDFICVNQPAISWNIFIFYIQFSRLYQFNIRILFVNLIQKQIKKCLLYVLIFPLRSEFHQFSGKYFLPAQKSGFCLILRFPCYKCQVLLSLTFYFLSYFHLSCPDWSHYVFEYTPITNPDSLCKSVFQALIRPDICRHTIRYIAQIIY